MTNFRKESKYSFFILIIIRYLWIKIYFIFII